MERNNFETLDHFENRLWAEHSAQASAAARAATSVAFNVVDGVAVGGNVVSNYNPLPEGWVGWTEYTEPEGFVYSVE